jgi:hypothetical protein
MSSKGHSWCLLCACARVSVYIWVPSSLLSHFSLSLFSLSLAVSLSLSLSLSHSSSLSLTHSLALGLSHLSRAISLSLAPLFVLPRSPSLSLSRARFCSHLGLITRTPKAISRGPEDFRSKESNRR